MNGLGRIFKRGQVFWIAYCHRGKEIRESARSSDERVARRLLRERLRKAGTPEFVGPAAERVTFEDVAEMYRQDFRVNAKRSFRDAERNTRELGKFFALTRCLDITGDRIGAYVCARLAVTTRLGGPPKPATINRELAALRRMFTLAMRAGRITHRPHIPMLAENNARQGFFEPAEFEAVLRELRPDLVDFARYAYLTGWRVGAVRSLEWRDVTLEKRGALVRGGVARLRAENNKTKRQDMVVLRGELLQVIVRSLAARSLDCPFVFHRDGRSIGDFRPAWVRACEAAGFAGRRFHDLRRSAVRNMVRAGVPERVAMAVSGHRTRSVFDRYNIVSEQDLAEAMERTVRYVAERRGRKPQVALLGQDSDKIRTIVLR